MEGWQAKLDAEVVLEFLCRENGPIQGMGDCRQPGSRFLGSLHLSGSSRSGGIKDGDEGCRESPKVFCTALSQNTSSLIAEGLGIQRQSFLERDTERLGGIYGGRMMPVSLGAGVWVINAKASVVDLS